MRVPVVEVKLPSEVRYFPGRSHHVDVIPPARRSPTYPLAVLHVAKQVRQLQTGVGPWVIAANEDGVGGIFLVPDVAQHPRSTREEVAFQFGPYSYLEVRMLERERSAVTKRDPEVSPQRLVDQHFPYPCKDLAPTAFTVPYIALLVKVISTSVGHQVVVASVEKALLNAPEVVAKALNFRSSCNVGRHGFPPLSHGFLEGKSLFAVKHGVESCSPAFREARASTAMVSIS